MSIRYSYSLAHHEDTRRSWGISPPIFNLGIRWSVVVNFIPLLFFLQAEGLWRHLNFMSYSVAYTEAVVRSPVCTLPSYLLQSVVLPLLLHIPTSSLTMSSQYVCLKVGSDIHCWQQVIQLGWQSRKCWRVIQQ